MFIWLAASAGFAPAVIVLLTAFFGFVGWWLPARILRERASRRLAEIDYTLPELIDLLVVTIEAGLGFVGSMQTARTRGSPDRSARSSG